MKQESVLKDAIIATIFVSILTCFSLLGCHTLAVHKAKQQVPDSLPAQPRVDKNK